MGVSVQLLISLLVSIIKHCFARLVIIWSRMKWACIQWNKHIRHEVDYHEDQVIYKLTRCKWRTQHYFFLSLLHLLSAKYSLYNSTDIYKILSCVISFLTNSFLKMIVLVHFKVSPYFEVSFYF